MERICEQLGNLLRFEVKLMNVDGEIYLCVFHDKSMYEDSEAIIEIMQVAYLVKCFINKYSECVIASESINTSEGSPVNCVFRLEEPMLSKEVLKSEYGIDCNWQNEDECIHQSECISFGECVYLQEYEDRCL